MSPVSRGWHCDRDSFGAGTRGSPWGLHQAGSPWIKVWSLPPTPCPVLLPLGRAATGQTGGGCHLREPNADSCLLAGILAVYRKPTSCFDLRDMGDKPVLVAPKNPLVGMRSNPGICWALLGLWLCSSCSIPPNPASNKSALPSPS